MGLLPYVAGRTIPELAEKTALTRKGAKFEWKEEQQAAFEKLIEDMKNITHLSYYSKTDRTRLFADGSPHGLGAVLVQMDVEGNTRPIACVS